MDCMPQFGEQPQETKGNSLRKSNSVELRAGKLYPTCYCIKRNGLQNDCQRSECQGKTIRMKKSASAIGSSNSTSRLSNYNMGSCARQNATAHGIPIQKVGESHPLSGSETLLTNGTDISDFKDIDPKLLSQMYQQIQAQPYTQYSSTPKIPTFDQSFHSMQMDQSNQLMATSQPQIANATFVDTPKAGGQMAGQTMFSMSPTISELPQNFTNKMPRPIAAIEPMPSIQTLSSTDNYSPAGMQMQSCGISGQFAPYMGSLNPMNPYSPSVASYLPYSTANLTSMATGIPCSSTQ